MTLFDSDVFIWHLRGLAAAQEMLLKLDEPALSAVTLIEVLQGARNKAEQRTCRTTVTELGAPVLPITPAITDRAIRLIDAHALKDSLTLGDALIAATVLEHGLSLVSANRKHFAPIKGLSLIVFEP